MTDVKGLSLDFEGADSPASIDGTSNSSNGIGSSKVTMTTTSSCP